MQFKAVSLLKIKINVIFIPSPLKITKKLSQLNNFKIFTFLHVGNTSFKIFFITTKEDNKTA